MRVEPGKKGEPPGEPEKAPKGKPPGDTFKKKMEGVGGKKGKEPERKEPPKKPKTPFDLKKGKVQQQKATQAQQQAQEEAALAALADQGQREGSVSLSADVKASGFGSAVDKIISVFQNNAVFGSRIGQLQVNVKGAETNITVLLQNNVQVDINLTGGQDINIQIQGLTDAAQTAMDNAAHQQMLREKLAEQGFTIHQIQTFRAEGPPAPGAPLPPPPLTAAPPGGAEQQPFREGEEGGGGGREGRREGEEEQP